MDKRLKREITKDKEELSGGRTNKKPFVFHEETKGLFIRLLVFNRPNQTKARFSSRTISSTHTIFSSLYKVYRRNSRWLPNRKQNGGGMTFPASKIRDRS